MEYGAASSHRTKILRAFTADHHFAYTDEFRSSVWNDVCVFLAGRPRTRESHAGVVVVDGAKQLGYAPDIVFSLGVTLLSCVAAYLFPRTSVLGAMLLTGYLGGAVATHVRVGSPLFTHVLFPTYVAALLWGSLVLRDARVRALLLRADRSRS